MKEEIEAKNTRADRIGAALFEFVKLETTNPEGCSQ